VFGSFDNLRQKYLETYTVIEIAFKLLEKHTEAFKLLQKVLKAFMLLWGHLDASRQ